MVIQESVSFSKPISMIISSDVKRDGEKLQEGISNSVLAAGKTHSFQQLCLQYGKQPNSVPWDLSMGLKLVPTF